jgi:hypothetical protein
MLQDFTFIHGVIPTARLISNWMFVVVCAGQVQVVEQRHLLPRIFERRKWHLSKFQGLRVITVLGLAETDKRLINPMAGARITVDALKILPAT